MAFLKFSADSIFDGRKFWDANSVLVADDKGFIETILPNNEGLEDVQKLKGILTPGFINCHCHLELSHLKNLIPKHQGLIDFIKNIIRHRTIPVENKYLSIQNALDNMLEKGIVAVGDIMNETTSMALKQKSLLHFYNFVELSGWQPERAKALWIKALEIEAAIKHYNKNAKIAIVPHAPYSVSTSLWEKIKTQFSEKTITIHNQESREETQLFKEGKGNFIELFKQLKIENRDFLPDGNTSLQTVFPHLEKAKNIILVHNTYTTTDDINHLSAEKDKNRVYFCLCPAANLYIENTLPPVENLLLFKDQIVIGTDSLASNDDLDILKEIKIIEQNFPSIEQKTLLQWATLNGARALQMEAYLGSFEKGKRPGLNLVQWERGSITAPFLPF